MVEASSRAVNHRLCAGRRPGGGRLRGWREVAAGAVAIVVWFPLTADACPMREKPPEQRPELPDFWCKRFTDGATPWESRHLPAALRRFAEAREAPAAILVPGCGSAWEVGWLGDRGWSVTALDFSPTAVAAARQTLGEDWPGCLVCGDFFDGDLLQGPFDLIYERAFLCALPRKLWPAWAARVAALLPPGGALVGFFYFASEPKGPPFGLGPAQLAELLTPAFTLEDDRAVEDSIPLFAGRERWQVWRRR